jgi:large-conductance mechanosensitive channel
MIIYIIIMDINDISKFAVENNIFSFFIGTTIGFAASNLIKAFKTNIIDYYLLQIFNINQSNSNLILFITSIFEFLLIIYCIYLLYTFILKKILDKYKKSQDADIEWKKELLSTLQSIKSNSRLPSST